MNAGNQWGIIFATAEVPTLDLGILKYSQNMGAGDFTELSIFEYKPVTTSRTQAF